MASLSELSDGSEPHDHIPPAVAPVHPCSRRRCRGEGVPGVWYPEGGLGGLYRYPTIPSQDPYLVNSEVKDPTHGQMKAILMHYMRFLRLGPGYD